MAGKEIRDLLIKIKSTGGKQAFALLDKIDNKVAKGINKNLQKTNTNLNLIGRTLKRRIKDFEELKQAAKGTSSLGVASKSGAKAMTAMASSMDRMAEGLQTIIRQNNRMQDEVEMSNEVFGEQRDSMEGIARETRDATKAQKKFTAGNRKLGNQLKQSNKKGKGQAKMFSGLSSAGNGMIGIYASLAAGVFILDSAFRALKVSADLSRLEENIAALGNGRNLRAFASDLQDTAAGALSVDAALRLAAQSSALGFKSKEMQKMTVMARKASVALGIDFVDALSRVTKGIAKQEVELLDELGVVTRLEPAMKKYAVELGKTVQQLTDAERKQALYIETMKQMEVAYGKVNAASTEYEKLAANVGTIATSVGKAMSAFLNPAVEAFNSALEGTIANLKLFGDVEGALSASAMADSLVSNANAASGARVQMVNLAKEIKAVEAEQAKAAKTSKVSQLVNSREIILINQLAKLKGKYKELLVAEIGNLKASSNATAETVINLESMTKGFTEAGAKLSSFSTKSKKGLISFQDELEYSANLLRNLNGLQSENSAVTTEGLELQAKYLDKINTSFGTAFKSVEAYLAAWKLASSTATNFDDTNKSLEARNWALKESVTLKAQMVVLDERIAAAEALNLDSIVKGLNDKKTSLGYATEEVIRSEKKLRLDQLYAKNQEFALTTSRSQGETDAIRLGIQISFLEKRLDMEDKLLTNAGKRSLAAEKELLFQKQTIALIKEGNQIEGSKALTSAFGDQELADNQSNRELGNTEAVMQSGVDGVNTMLEALSSLDTATGSIANGFINLGQIMNQSMQNGSFGADAAAASISAVAGILSGINSRAVDEIDFQIAMERKRDGQSAKSVQKLKELNKKKLKEEQKAKLQSAIMSTASGIASALALPFPYNLVAAGITGAMGMMQVSAIRSQGKNAAALSATGAGANQSIQYGDRMNNVDISQSASAGERAFVTGQAGTGTNANNFAGAASGMHAKSGTAINVGERGGEVFIPDVPGTVVPSGDISPSSGGGGLSIQMNIDNIDAQSFIDRQEELLDAVDQAVRAKYGKSLEDM